MCGSLCEGAIAVIDFARVLLYREVAYRALKTMKLPETSPEISTIFIKDDRTNSDFAVCRPSQSRDFFISDIFSHVASKHQLLFLSITQPHFDTIGHIATSNNPAPIVLCPVQMIRLMYRDMRHIPLM